MGIDSITYQNLMVGGVDKEGKDATNELTWLCMQIQHAIQGAQPSLSMRCHPGTPPDLLEQASELILSGCGRPAMFNDQANIAALTNIGVPR